MKVQAGLRLLAGREIDNENENEHDEEDMQQPLGQPFTSDFGSRSAKNRRNAKRRTLYTWSKTQAAIEKVQQANLPEDSFRG